MKGRELKGVYVYHEDGDGPEEHDEIYGDLPEEIISNMIEFGDGFVKPSEEVCDEIITRLGKNNSEKDIEYYKVEYVPDMPDQLENNVDKTITVKIPEIAYRNLKRIAYFSGLKIKDVVTLLIAGESISLNKYLLDKCFDVDEGWYEISNLNSCYGGKRER